MAPEIEYVRVNADFKVDGVFLPLSLELKAGSGENPAGEGSRKRYIIEKVTGSETLSSEEVEQIFPDQSDLIPSTIYRYRVKIQGQESSLYFHRWPESGTMCLGRWFVIKKPKSR